MRISVITVGKIKEKYFKEAIAEYIKRLGSYCQLQEIEVPDEKCPETLSALEEIQVKDKEGQRILAKIRDTDYCIALAIEGKPLSSEGLASHLSDLGIKGRSDVAIIIGGSLGLSEAVLKRADFKLSFSAMTFPHQLMKVILMEQIYRAFRIMHGHSYHK